VGMPAGKSAKKKHYPDALNGVQTAVKFEFLKI
jgi:hypothetical protein